MLSDEEKKAIKKVKYICDKWYDESLEIDVKWLESLLSLCEKQSKEIEELNALRLKEINNTKYWVHKDKIKAKIKDLEKLNDESTGIGYWFAIYYLKSLLEKE